MCHDIYYLCIVFFYRIGTLGIALLETNENGGHVLTLAKMSLAMLFFIKFLLGLIGGLSMRFISLHIMR